MSKKFCLVVALLTISTASFAQLGGDGQGTPQEQAACKPDVVKFCMPLLRSNAPSTFSILACLKGNRDQISKACRAVLDSHGQ
jgi:hypothetical protein